MAAMSRSRLVLLTLAVLFSSEPASAALASIRAIDLTPRTAAVASASQRFELVGVHWKGPGLVQVRARAVGGGWSAWRDVTPGRADGPDSSAAEAASRAGWRIGSPDWTGPSDHLEVRTRGRVTAVRAWTISSPAVLVPLRRAAGVGVSGIVSRSAWGADESIRRSDPVYAPELRYAVVHHTAGKNAYTRAEAPAIVRGIQLYHVQANGWNDIGYNFLVDRFGAVYEGRYGGVDANVVGAHAQGFNTGSTGVALIGSFGTTTVPSVAESALERLLAWRLDLAHVDPDTTLMVASGGSPRFAAGLPVQLRTVSGHRDTGYTACPGDALYARLDQVAAVTQSTGLPKLYEPLAAVDGAHVAFHARLSEPLAWTVTVTDAQGAVVAGGSGTGGEIAWQWDAQLAPAGDYGWLMEAGSGDATVTAASGVVASGAVAPALALVGVEPDSETVSPNADGVADTQTVAYELTAPATVAVVVVDADGVEVLEPEPARWKRAGAHAATIDPADLPDGTYVVRLRARTAAAEEAMAEVALIVTRTLGSVVAAPAVLSPNGDGRADRLRLAFTLTKPADVTVTVLRAGGRVAVAWSGRLPPGRRAVRWDGTKPDGIVRDGDFVAAVEAFDGAATARIDIPFAVDATPPRLRLVAQAPLQLAVSEAAAIRIRVDGVVRRMRVERPTTVTVAGAGVWRTLVADAWDPGGNAAPTLRARRAAAPGK